MFNRQGVKNAKRLRTPPLEHVTLKKFFGGACPRTPLKPLFFFDPLQMSSAEKKNTLEKNVEVMPPPILNLWLRHCLAQNTSLQFNAK